MCPIYKVAYILTSDGGVILVGRRLRIETSDVELLQAVHEFLHNQIAEHHTDDRLDAKR
jgi:hypothetical protein